MGEEMRIELPHACIEEATLLGAIFTQPKALFIVNELLKPEHFYKAENRVIYATILDLFNKDLPYDISTVSSKVFEMGLSEKDFSMFTSENPNPKKVQHDSRKIYEKFMLRELIKYGQRLTSVDDKEDPFDLIEEVEQKVFDITQGCYKKTFVELKHVHNETLRLLEAIKQKGVNEFILPTGFLDLDNRIGGFKKTDLIIVAGRPSMGKTSFALNIANNIAINKPVGFFSLEMSSTQLSARLISMETGISVDKLLSGQFQDSDALTIQRSVTKINNLPMFIDDTSSLNIFELKSKAKHMKVKHDIGAIFVDYLQLCTTERGLPREQQISLISGTLKGIAKELNIPVIALSQMNRGVEQRLTKKPQLSDLRESGAIEQDADMVIFVHRPEVYDIKFLDDPSQTPTENLAQIIISKNRNGAIGDVNLTFIKHQTKFENYYDARFQ